MIQSTFLTQACLQKGPRNKYTPVEISIPSAHNFYSNTIFTIRNQGYLDKWLIPKVWWSWSNMTLECVIMPTSKELQKQNKNKKTREACHKNTKASPTGSNT